MISIPTETVLDMRRDEGIGCAPSLRLDKIVPGVFHEWKHRLLSPLEVPIVPSPNQKILNGVPDTGEAPPVE
jgi:hypothetical protein